MHRKLASCRGFQIEDEPFCSSDPGIKGGLKDHTERGMKESHIRHKCLITILGKPQLKRQRCPRSPELTCSSSGAGNSRSPPDRRRVAQRWERETIITSGFCYSLQAKHSAPHWVCAQCSLSPSCRALTCEQQQRPKWALLKGEHKLKLTPFPKPALAPVEAPEDEAACPHLGPHASQLSVSQSSTGDPQVSSGMEAKTCQTACICQRPALQPHRCLARAGSMAFPRESSVHLDQGMSKHLRWPLWCSSNPLCPAAHLASSSH